MSFDSLISNDIKSLDAVTKFRYMVEWLYAVDDFPEFEDIANRKSVSSYWKNLIILKSDRQMFDLISLGRITPQQLRSFFVSQMLKGNEKLSFTPINQVSIHREFFTNWSPEKLEKDKTNFKGIHQNLKPLLGIDNPKQYLDYRLDRKDDYKYSILFKLYSDGVITPIFYWYFLNTTGLARVQNYDALSVVPEEERLRTFLSLLNL